MFRHVSVLNIDTSTGPSRRFFYTLNFHLLGAAIIHFRNSPMIAKEGGNVGGGGKYRSSFQFFILCEQTRKKAPEESYGVRVDFGYIELHGSGFIGCF